MIDDEITRERSAGGAIYFRGFGRWSKIEGRNVAKGFVGELKATDQVRAATRTHAKIIGEGWVTDGKPKGAEMTDGTIIKGDEPVCACEAFSGGDWVIDRGFRDVMFGGDHSTSEDDFLTVYPDFDPVAVLDPNDQAPADVVEVHGPHQEANARLIAGAGDLFHSVVALRDFIVAAYDGPGATELIERADAAITAVREGRKS